MKPYAEHIESESVAIRTFSVNIPEEELQWHWDEQDRIVTPMCPTDWLFQFDNELPFVINIPIFIPAGVIHRVIKGSQDLIVKIEKL